MAKGSYMAGRISAILQSYDRKVDSYTFLCRLCSVFWDLNTVGRQNTEKQHRNFSSYKNCVSVFYVLIDDDDDDVDVTCTSPISRT